MCIKKKKLCAIIIHGVIIIAPCIVINFIHCISNFNNYYINILNYVSFSQQNARYIIIILIRIPSRIDILTLLLFIS